MTKTTIIITLLVALAGFYLVSVLREGFYLALLPLLGVAVAASVAILAFRATMVTWVTVLVLLSFAGNRRKVLVQRGRRITVDVAWYLVRSQKKGLFALACFFSLLATYR